MEVGGIERDRKSSNLLEEEKEKRKKGVRLRACESEHSHLSLHILVEGSVTLKCNGEGN